MLYAALPPEVNSGRIYAGPGSAPMLEAAAAWEASANELQFTAARYMEVITTLTSALWMGPSSLAMAAAGMGYVTWLYDTAARAAQVATQATAAAIAYEVAFAAHVPPVVIAANRAQLAALLASNLFGQNTGAIANTDIEYGEMWTQDAMAMYDYAKSSAAAGQITPFTVPPEITNASGLGAQAAAAGQATGTAVGHAAQTIASHTGPIGELLHFFSNIADEFNKGINSLLDAFFPGGSAGYLALYNAIKVPIGVTTQFNDIGLLINLPVSQVLKFGTKPSALLGELPKDALGGGLGLGAPHWGRGTLTSAPVTGNFGRGTMIGALTVPPSWTANTPGIRMVAAALSAAGPEAVPAAALGEGSLLSSMSMAGMVGSALGAGGPSALSRVGVKGKLTPLKDLKEKDSPEKLKQLVAQISEKPESVQHHNVDQEGLDSLLEQLAKKPGIHAVHLSKGDKPKVVPSDARLG